MFKYFFILRGINDKTKAFIKKYFNKPYPKKDQISPSSFDASRKDVIRIRGMQPSLYKKYFSDLSYQKLSDEQIENYEERLADTILKSKSHRHIKEAFDIFVYIFSEILHKRSYIVEESVLEKDFSTVTSQPSRNTKYNKWPIMDGIIKYVKEVMGGEWPEFEEKLTESSPFNLTYYHAKIGTDVKEPETVVDDNPDISVLGIEPEVPLI